MKILRGALAASAILLFFSTLALADSGKDMVKDIFWFMMTDSLERKGILTRESEDGPALGPNDRIVPDRLLFSSNFDFSSDGWPEDWNANRRGGGYHLIGPPMSAYHVWREMPSGKVVIGVDMTCLADQNEGYGFGVNIRKQGYEEEYYSFRITSTGDYIVYRFDGTRGEELYYRKLAEGRNHPALRKGWGATNRLEIRTWDSVFDLFLNGEFVTRIADNIYPSGGIGLRVSARQHVVFDNFTLHDARVVTVGGDH